MSIRIGVLCPSEIAYRRFMPAIGRNFEYAGVAVPSYEDWSGTGFNSVSEAEYNKALLFKENYGGCIYEGYLSLINDPYIDAVYIPLPPSLHFKYALKALEAGKHVLVEKPCTTSLEDTKALVDEAQRRDLVVHENYAFVYHSQIDYLKKIIRGGEIGDVRLIRLDFGYPFRGKTDFRYHKELGGSALLDIGGYPLFLAAELLGDSAKLVCHTLNYDLGFSADIGGSATLINDHGLTAQIGFGSMNEYRCSIDIWGSKASVYSGRVFSAPAGFVPEIIITQGGKTHIQQLLADDSFARSLDAFGEKIASGKCSYKNMLFHAELFERLLK